MCNSLDNLAQGQIIRSPRNMGKGHINLPAEELRCAQEEGREAACSGSIPSPCQPDESAAGRESEAVAQMLLRLTTLA